MREIGAMTDLVILIDQEILRGGGKTLRTEISKIGLQCLIRQCRILGPIWLDRLIFKIGLLCLIRLCRILGTIWLEYLPTCPEYPLTTIWGGCHPITIWVATTIMGSHHQTTCRPTTWRPITIMGSHHQTICLPTAMECLLIIWGGCRQTWEVCRHLQMWEGCRQTTWEEGRRIQHGLITCLTQNTRIATLRTGTWGLVETVTKVVICPEERCPRPQADSCRHAVDK